MKIALRKFFPLPLADVILLPFVYPAAFLMKKIRGAGLQSQSQHELWLIQHRMTNHSGV